MSLLPAQFFTHTLLVERVVIALGRPAVHSEEGIWMVRGLVIVVGEHDPKMYIEMAVHDSKVAQAPQLGQCIARHAVEACVAGRHAHGCGVLHPQDLHMACKRPPGGDMHCPIMRPEHA
ncbi:hypothetical protein AMTR_s00218p00025110 [Amborella trichopoda]|uniref:Uncharacterized protein n=1 Tax=Amborella trichopoda TaxID=13333 RepID=W1NT60_AMBTC|nr:hypothetical protein AMTR_s00218p00025110 [Amborella trichopoda]